MNTTFRNAFLISMMVHASVIWPFYNSTVLQERQLRKERIVVDYIVEPRMAIETEKPVRNPETESPRIETRAEVREEPVAAAPPSRKPVSRAYEKELAEKQARIRGTKDYLSYYQLIREKIRRRLKDNYKPDYGEGDVYLSFALRSDGKLNACGYDRNLSVRDRTLIELAITSVKEASPFHSFPDSMDLPTMTFDLMVSFRKD
jgi:hypothetical protein